MKCKTPSDGFSSLVSDDGYRLQVFYIFLIHSPCTAQHFKKPADFHFTAKMETIVSKLLIFAALMVFIVA